MKDQADNSAAAGLVIPVAQQCLDSRGGCGSAEVRLLACRLLFSLTTSAPSASKAVSFGIVAVLRKQLGQASAGPEEACLLARTLSRLVGHGYWAAVRARPQPSTPHSLPARGLPARPARTARAHFCPPPRPRAPGRRD